MRTRKSIQAEVSEEVRLLKLELDKLEKQLYKFEDFFVPKKEEVKCSLSDEEIQHLLDKGTINN